MPVGIIECESLLLVTALRLRRITMGLSNTEQKRNRGLIPAGLVMLLVLVTPLAYAQEPS